MKCPVCGHDTSKALLKCSECNAYFDRQVLEQYEHLAYMLAWLGEIIWQRPRLVLAKTE